MNENGDNLQQLPTEEAMQEAMLEATLNAAVLLKTLLKKQSISSEERNIADIALRFLEITSNAGAAIEISRN